MQLPTKELFRFFSFAALLASAPDGIAQSSTMRDEARGFSYFLGLGQQAVTYRETPSILPVKTRVETSSPLLTTGGVYAITTDLLFSLDTQTTFAPNTTTETWRATGSTFAGQMLTSDVLQKNDFKLQQSNTQLMAEYRIRDNWFAIAGPAFRSQTFKRFSFRAGPDNATSVPANQVIEESTSELLWQMGAALESEQLRNRKTHYSARAFLAKPIWREVENTAVPDKTFHGNGGYDFVVEGRYSYALLDNVHLGLWAQYLVSKREGETACVANTSGSVASNRCAVANAGETEAELPDSRLTGYAYGLEMLWKL